MKEVEVSVPEQSNEARMEEAFLSAVHKDAKLRGILEQMTEPSDNLRGDWSCCIHVNSK